MAIIEELDDEEDEDTSMDIGKKRAGGLAFMKMAANCGLSLPQLAEVMQSGDEKRIEALWEKMQNALPEGGMSEEDEADIMRGIKAMTNNDEEYEQLLASAEEQATAAVEADPHIALLKQRVQITGLNGRQELNGKFGSARSYDKDKGRLVVRLEDGDEKILVRPANLELAPPKPKMTTKHPLEYEYEQKERMKRNMRIDAGLTPSEPRPEDLTEDVDDEEEMKEKGSQAGRLRGLSMAAVPSVVAQMGKDNVIVYLEPYRKGAGAFNPTEEFFFLVAKTAPAQALFGAIRTGLGLAADTPVELYLGGKNKGFLSSGPVQILPKHRMSKYSGKADDGALHIEVRIPVEVERPADQAEADAPASTGAAAEGEVV